MRCFWPSFGLLPWANCHGPLRADGLQSSTEVLARQLRPAQGSGMRMCQPLLATQLASNALTTWRAALNRMGVGFPLLVLQRAQSSSCLKYQPGLVCGCSPKQCSARIGYLIPFPNHLQNPPTPSHVPPQSGLPPWKMSHHRSSRYPWQDLRCC